MKGLNYRCASGGVRGQRAPVSHFRFHLSLACTSPEVGRDKFSIIAELALSNEQDLSSGDQIKDGMPGQLDNRALRAGAPCVSAEPSKELRIHCLI